jgi:hypothetical protein
VTFLDATNAHWALCGLMKAKLFEKKFMFGLATAVVTYSSIQAIVGFSS